MQQTEFLAFWAIFCPFTLLATQKIKILKLKKTPEYIIILQMYTINESYDAWFLRYGVQQNFLSFWIIFPLLPPLTNQKIKILKKWRICLEILSFYKVFHKWQSYDVWFLKYQARCTESFVILYHFLHFYPPTNPKNQIFEKMEKAHGDIIILHRCNITDNHMIYGSWDMEHDGQFFCNFGLFFCPFTLHSPLLTTRKNQFLYFYPLNNPKKSKFWKNEKSNWGCYHFTHVYKKNMTICFTVPKIRHIMDAIVIFHFVLFFALLPPYSLKNQN